MNIIQGDCRDVLSTLPEQHFHCCVTSPPYLGLRDYGVGGQIGLEATPDAFVDEMVRVFRGVWRVLRDDGVLWLNLGDKYADAGGPGVQGKHVQLSDGNGSIAGARERRGGSRRGDCKPKDLMGMPWRVALALQADGWYLRDAIIWHKPSPMPGSQRDRCTSSYEFIFQLTKRPRYYFDLEAIKEPASPNTHARISQDLMQQVGSHRANGGGKSNGPMKAAVAGSTRKLAEAGSGIAANTSYEAALAMPVTTAAPRNVWRIPAEPCSDAHFATYPSELPVRCIKASTSEWGCCPICGEPYQRTVDREAVSRERPNELTKRTGEEGTGNHCANTVAGVSVTTTGWEVACPCIAGEPAPCRVLDPFNGAGTTGIACRRLGREYTGIELNPEYIALSHKRLRQEANRGDKRTKVRPSEDQQELFA